MKKYILYFLLIVLLSNCSQSGNNEKTEITDSLEAHELSDTSISELINEIKLNNISIDDIENELYARGYIPDNEDSSKINKSILKNPLFQEYPDTILIKSLKGIYGPNDDRMDLYQILDNVKLNNSKTVVGLIFSNLLKKTTDNSFQIITMPYGKSYYLCSTERFWEQPTAVNCSGFAIGKRYIITAGHCINKANMNKFKFIFGFNIQSKDNVCIEISEGNVYTPIEIISRFEDAKSGVDFAIVKVDKDIPNERRVKLCSEDFEYSIGKEVYAIGHPMGLPLKIAGGAFIRDNESPNFFIANLDTYAGNSGSPVFDNQTHEVIGILFRGDRDLVWSPDNCKISNWFPNNGGLGEDVFKITNILDKLPINE